jgi:hypothetical protein
MTIRDNQTSSGEAEALSAEELEQVSGGSSLAALFTTRGLFDVLRVRLTAAQKPGSIVSGPVGLGCPRGHQRAKQSQRAQPEAATDRALLAAVLRSPAARRATNG